MTLGSPETSSNKIDFRSPEIWLLVIIGACLRFTALGSQSVWLDEAYSCLISQNRFPEIFHQQIQDSSPPLYYFILHVWMWLWGSSEAAIRSLSAIAGTSLIFIGGLIGKEMGNRQTGFISALLLTISPLHLYYAQETRMYTWAAFWTSLAILSLLRVSCYRSWAVIYTLSLSACIWTHNYGWLLFAGAILFSVHQRLKIGWYHFTVFLLVSPWLMIMIRQLGADTTPWIPKPLPSFLWETIIHYSGVPPFLSSAVLIQSVVDIGAASLIILVLMASLRSITRIKALFYFVLLPLGMAFFLSYLKPIYLPGRHDFLFHTLFLSLAACAITPSVPLKKIAYGILFLFGCIQFYYGHLYFARFEKSNDREVAAYLKTMDLSEDDIMITTDLSASPLIYYLGKNFAIFQPFPEGQAGWLPRKLLENDTRYISNEINRFSSLLDAYSGNGDRVILVVCSEIPGTKELQSFLDQHLVYEKSYVFTPARRYNQIHSLRCYHFPETGLFAEPENLDSQASEGTRAVSNSLTSTP